MTIRKLLTLTGLMLLVFPLRHPEFVNRVADDCDCDLKDLGCKIVCSNIGSRRGTGGGSSTFDIAPRGDGPPRERPIVVPRSDVKNPTELTK